MELRKYGKDTWAKTRQGAQVPPEMCSGSEAGSYLRLIDFVYHSTLGLRVIKKRRRGDKCVFLKQVTDCFNSEEGLFLGAAGKPPTP